MSVDKVDNRPYKPDKLQWTWFGIVNLIIVIVILFQLTS